MSNVFYSTFTALWWSVTLWFLYCVLTMSLASRYSGISNKRAINRCAKAAPAFSYLVPFTMVLIYLFTST